MDAALSHPDLYRPTDQGVALLAMRCARCGHVAFPRQPYGCEKCGATAAEDVELAAAGTLASFATVHLHQSKSIAAPFVIGEIALDGGPTIRITLVEPTDEGLRIGARMSGVLFPVASDDAPKVELRFTPETPR
jgi:uncharacterized OB-fold protein